MESTTYLIYCDEKVTTESGGSFNYIELVHKMKGTEAEVKKYIKDNLPNCDYYLIPLTEEEEKAGPPYFKLQLKENKELTEADKADIKFLEDIFEPLKDMFKITIATEPKDQKGSSSS